MVLLAKDVYADPRKSGGGGDQGGRLGKPHLLFSLASLFLSSSYQTLTLTAILNSV